MTSRAGYRECAALDRAPQTGRGVPAATAGGREPCPFAGETGRMGGEATVPAPQPEGAR
jgi:hypothetical protein